MHMEDNLNSPSFEKPNLAVHEWISVVIIMGFFITLTMVSLRTEHSYESIALGEAHYLKPQIIEVFVQGSVEKPGSHQIHHKMKLKDLLEIVKPLNEADLKRLKPESKLKNGQVIKISAKPLITVNFIGAVEKPGSYTIPKGTRLYEIGRYVPLSGEVDMNKISKKRILKSNEVVDVPSK